MRSPHTTSFAQEEGGVLTRRPCGENQGVIKEGIVRRYCWKGVEVFFVPRRSSDTSLRGESDSNYSLQQRQEERERVSSQENQTAATLYAFLSSMSRGTSRLFSCINAVTFS